ncbi:MAG TPA: sulfurtransferase TusA family protein [Dehalococcoidia bacterium]|nr:sulfurtransferase TusA family protein [Dehalococcoidia bacterium]
MKLLDLRGCICPMNWVKTKLALEEMEPGEMIEVWLDDGEPIRNVPRSAAGEGHRVVRVAPQDSFFRVLIKRGGDS